MDTIDELKRETRVPIVIADQQGFITYVNICFKEHFGWSQDELVGKPLTTIIPGYLHDAHNLGFSRFQMTGKSTLLNRPLKLKTIAKDGREFNTEHFIIAEQNQGQWFFAAKLTPLSEEG